MKNLTLFLLVLMTTFFATSCVEEETSAVDVTGTATLKGIVFLENDVTDADQERANGAIVRVSYNAAELSVASDGDHRIVTLETTTDGNGLYSIELPATPEGVDFSIRVDDFETNYTYAPTDSTTATVDAIFEDPNSINFPMEIENLKVGETRVEDITLESKEIYF